MTAPVRSWRPIPDGGYRLDLMGAHVSVIVRRYPDPYREPCWRWEAVLAVGFDHERNTGLIVGSVKVCARNRGNLASDEKSAEDAMQAAEFTLALWRQDIADLDLSEGEEMIAAMELRERERRQRAAKESK